MSDKFDECRECKHRRTDVCDDCEYGEQFEDIEEEGLRFEYAEQMVGA